MKKTSFITGILCVAFAFAGNAANIYNSAQYNTKPWGCKYSKESHLEGSNRYDLYCYEPGEKICQFSDGSCPKQITWEQASDIVRAQINSGILNGTIQVADGCSLTWQGEDESNFSFTVTEE